MMNISAGIVGLTGEGCVLDDGLITGRIEVVEECKAGEARLRLE